MKTNNLGFLALALLPTLADAGSFTPLWNAGYERIQPTIVSADGLVAVGGTAGGRNLCGGTHAYSWSQQTGIAQLPNPVSTSYNYSCTYASGVSGTGEVIVGYATDGFQNGSSAVKWSSNSAELLPTRPITSISNDGTTIVSSASIGTGSIWTASSGWTPLPAFVGAGEIYTAGISGDGSTIVGVAESNIGRQAFRYTDAGGYAFLGDLPGGSVDSRALGVSVDGSVVVGFGTVAGTGYAPDAREAFRWTSGSGLVGLGLLSTPGVSYRESIAYAVSADGSVVVGTSTGDDHRTGGSAAEAFIWTEAAGMQRLFDLLVSLGIPEVLQTCFDPNDGATCEQPWRITAATGISADGKTIGGTAVDRGGNQRAFIANISPVPIPPAAWLFGSALGLMGVMRRKVS